MTLPWPVRYALSRAARFAALGLACGLGACLDNEGADADSAAGSTAGKLDSFIAQSKDFAKFRDDWMRFDVSDMHASVAGTVVVYLNELPDKAATAFPVGTMVVKTMEVADTSDLNIHAMVKRGANFNPNGAKGWEYFELALSKTDGHPFVLWRGEKPPNGEQYQRLLSQNDITNQDTEDDCNTCHAHEPAKDGTFDALAELLK